VLKLVLAAVLAAAMHVPPSHARVPILMYHVIASAPAEAPYPGLYVPPAEFSAEMNWLAAHHYHAVSLEQVFRAWHGSDVLPSRPVVLSFDDGYRSDYTAALPILRDRHWSGVLNMLVANLKPVWGLRPGEVRKLMRAGWELDAHTLTHRDLTALAPPVAWREIDGSRLALRREFHVPVDFFCYPSGRWDTAVVEDVRRAGYEGATTEAFGLASPSQDPYVLDRVRVSGGEGAAGLAASFAALGLPH
jgi:peptidoglycan/xylan/chitin deacetylase (PgdA/CDA1 family)